MRFLFYDLNRFSKELEEIGDEKEFLARPARGKNSFVNHLRDNLRKVLSRATDIVAENVEKDIEIRMKNRELEYAQKLKESVNKLEKEVQRTNLLLKVTQYTVSNLDLNSLLDSISNTVGEILGYNHFALLLKTVEEKLKVVTIYGLDEKIRGVEFEPGEGVSSMVLKSGESLYVPDTSKEPKYLYYKGKFEERGSFLSIPIKILDETIGVMNFHSFEIDYFSEKDIELLQGVSHITGIAIKNAQLYEKVKSLAERDELTGVYNRRHILDKLSENVKNSLRSKKPLTVSMLDFNDFKRINDTFGHLTGDKVLRDSVKIIKEALRKTDLLGRYGGDEFLLILPFTSEKGAKVVHKKIKDSLKNYTHLVENGKKISLSVTIGYKTYTSEDLKKGNVDVIKDVDDILMKFKRKELRNEL